MAAFFHAEVATTSAKMLWPGVFHKINGAEMPVANESVLEAQERNDEEQLREYHQLRRKAWVSVLAGFIAMALSMPLMSMASAGGLQRMKTWH